MRTLFLTIAEITLAITPLLLTALLFSRFGRKFSAGCRYAIWCILLLRLAIPFNISLPTPAIDLAPALPEPVPPLSIMSVPEDYVVPPLSVDPDYVFEYTIPTPETVYIDQTATLPPVEVTLDPAVVLSWLWLIGTVAVLAYTALTCLLSAARLHRWKLPVNDEHLLNALDEAREAVGLRRKVRLWLCPEVSSPLLRGLIRPEILLPHGEYTDEELDAILRHELIHCRRGDLWWKLLGILASALHFFNPLVWAAKKQQEIEMEQSCDDAVFRSGNVSRKTYGEAMLAVAREGISSPSAGLNTQFHASAKTLKARFANILDTTAKRTGVWLVVLALLIAAVIGGLVSCREDSYDPEKAEEEIIALAKEEALPEDRDPFATYWVGLATNPMEVYVTFDGDTATLSALCAESVVSSRLPYWADITFAYADGKWTVTGGLDGTLNVRTLEEEAERKGESIPADPSTTNPITTGPNLPVDPTTVGGETTGEPVNPTVLSLITPLIDGTYYISLPFGFHTDANGDQQFHRGVDYAAAAGTAVFAAAPGTVTEVNYNAELGWGNYVRIDHGNGYVTGYHHLQTVAVQTGQQVDYSDLIGTVGETGHTMGPCLCFTLSNANGDSMDPESNLFIRSLKASYYYTIHHDLPTLHCWIPLTDPDFSAGTVSRLGSEYTAIDYVLEKLYGEDHKYGQYNLRPEQIVINGKRMDSVWEIQYSSYESILIAMQAGGGQMYHAKAVAPYRALSAAWYEILNGDMGTVLGETNYNASAAEDPAPLFEQTVWFVKNEQYEVKLTGQATVQIELDPTPDTAPLPQTNLPPYTAAQDVSGLMDEDTKSRVAAEYDSAFTYINRTYGPNHGFTKLTLTTAVFGDYTSVWSAEKQDGAGILLAMKPGGADYIIANISCLDSGILPLGAGDAVLHLSKGGNLFPCPLVFALSTPVYRYTMATDFGTTTISAGEKIHDLLTDTVRAKLAAEYKTIVSYLVKKYGDDHGYTALTLANHTLMFSYAATGDSHYHVWQALKSDGSGITVAIRDDNSSSYVISSLNGASGGMFSYPRFSDNEPFGDTRLGPCTVPPRFPCVVGFTLPASVTASTETANPPVTVSPPATTAEPEETALQNPTDEGYCAHYIALSPGYHYSAYHNFPSHLINMVGEDRFNDWLQTQMGKTTCGPNIVQLIRDFGITEARFEQMFLHDASLFYGGDYNLEILFHGNDAEIKDYYTSGQERVNTLNLERSLLVTKRAITSYLTEHHGGALNTWTEKKARSIGALADGVQFSVNRIQFWSIAEVTEYFDISEETLKSISSLRHLPLDTAAICAPDAYTKAKTALGGSPSAHQLDLYFLRLTPEDMPIDFVRENPVRYYAVDERFGPYDGWRYFGAKGEIQTVSVPERSTYTSQMYSSFVRNDIGRIYTEALPTDAATLAAYMLENGKSFWQSMNASPFSLTLKETKMMTVSGISLCRAIYTLTENGRTADWIVYFLCEGDTASAFAVRPNDSFDTVLAMADRIVGTYRAKAA